MSRNIKDFKVGDKIVQRMHKGKPRSQLLPYYGTITAMVWVDDGSGDGHLNYYIDGQNVGWLYEHHWLYQ